MLAPAGIVAAERLLKPAGSSPEHTESGAPIVPAVTLLTTTLTAKSVAQVFEVDFAITITLSAIAPGRVTVPSGVSATVGPFIVNVYVIVIVNVYVLVIEPMDELTNLA